MLHPCPRCTQMLPAYAAFCRRCGATVGFASLPISPAAKKRVSILTPLLIVLLITALIFAGLVGRMVPQQVQSNQPAAYPTPRYVSPAPVIQAYPTVRMPTFQIPQFPKVMISPDYPYHPPSQYHEVPMIHHRDGR